MSSHGPEPQVHALCVPELLDLVVDLLDMSDWFSLMRTCGSIFPVIASRVWREVEAEVILDLIVEVTQVNDSGNNIADDSLDFTRFDFYAPFVRQLLVRGRTARDFEGERRRVCTQRAQQGTLLPNVESVTLLTSDLDPNSESLLWLDLFLTPSVRELIVEPAATTHTAWVSYPVTSNILGKLVNTCSAIETLKLCPKDITRGDSIGPGDVGNSTSQLWPFSPRDFGACTQLRRVTSTVLILSDGGFAALGALPRLEYLSIWGCGEHPESLQLYAPDDSFPALTQLDLLDIDPTNLLAIMGVKQFSSGLTSLALSTDFGDASYDMQGCEHWLTQSLPRLLQHTSQLKCFIYEASNHRGSHLSYSIDPMPLFRVLSRIPLQHVSFFGIRFKNWDFCEYLPMAFPQMTVLRMSSLSSAYLPWFAKIPNLRHLELAQLGIRVLPPALPGPTGPLETLNAAFTLAGFGTPVDAEQVARFLLSLWPTLPRVNAPRPLSTYGQHDWIFAGEINQQIGLIKAGGKMDVYV
ncbi:hypothetical protein FS749_016730 [Ceratobasidium sp. UAMH 11750]|nr:hypothetical protein FS749_016730 [Ceratobasidium sp. UAMH 11750]